MYIALSVRTAMVVHGFAADNQEIIEKFDDEPFVEKLISIDRIQSATEKYLLVTSSHGRVMYWEYKGGLAALKERLERAGLVVA